MGSRSSDACEYWGGGKATEGDSGPPADGDRVVPPWSGGALGLSDVAFVGARGKPLIVGVVGPHNAGKTTFLAAIFLLLLRSGKAGANLFAGSYTFAGWERIASHMKWTGSESPHFPPHTTAFESRAPGLLHLAFRRERTELSDVLFADGPGEWFRAWAFNRDAPGAEGARWVALHADVFLVFVDCDALAGADRGTARVILKQIIDRLGSERRNRPVYVVWSKCDIQPSSEMRSAVRRSLEPLGRLREFELSVRPLPPADEVPECRFLEVVEHLLSVPALEAPMVTAPLAVGFNTGTAVADNFLSFRGRSCG